MFKTSQDQFREYMQDNHGIPPVDTQDWKLADAAETLHRYFCSLDSNNYEKAYNANLTIAQLADCHAQLNPGLRRVLKERD